MDAEIKALQKEIKNLRSEVIGMIGEAFSEIKDEVKSELKEGPQGKEGKPGKDSTVAGPQGLRGAQGQKGDKGADSTVPGPRGPMGPQGRAVKGPKGDDGSPDTHIHIADKLNKHSELIEIKVVKGLDIRLKKFQEAIRQTGSKPAKMIHGGGMTLKAGAGQTLTRNTDGTWTLSGGTAANFVDNEIVGGSGTSWTLANTPVAGSVHLKGGGGALIPGVGNDYTISGKNITTANSYAAGQLLADYRS